MSAELWPYARTGGLGQAVADLAAEQSRRGLDVNVAIPLYRSVRETIGPLEPFGPGFFVHQNGAVRQARCVEKRNRNPGPRVLFVDDPESFDRPGLYGDEHGDFPDNGTRFAVFCQGVLEIARSLRDRRLVVHAHDWHAALLCVYMRHQKGLEHVPCVLTVHNGGYQGLFGPETLHAVGLPAYLWSPAQMEWYERLSFLKGGLRFADFVTTVSRTHAGELKTETGGFGLHDVFRVLDTRFVGIRNGIDEQRWNPRIDPHIAARFSEVDLRGKAVCRRELQRACGLPQRSDVPVIAMVARMVAQKGLDLVLGSRFLRERDVQVVFLGEGEARYERALAAFAREHPDRVAVNTRFTDRGEHAMLAGADFLLMPSLYEPCGLTQMRAQRYGTLPVVRRVGGLADTVTDAETGFVFDDYSAASLDVALDRALNSWAVPAAHNARVRGAMRSDFSWSEPIARYVDLYRRALETRAPQRQHGLENRVQMLTAG